MGIFKWLTRKFSMERKEEGILILDLKLAIKTIKKARIRDVSNAQAYEPTGDGRKFIKNINNSIGLLENSMENAILILRNLKEKKIPKTYRGGHNLTDEELISFEFLPSFIEKIKRVIKLLKKINVNKYKSNISIEAIYHNKDIAIRELQKLLNELIVIK